MALDVSASVSYGERLAVGIILFTAGLGKLRNLRRFDEAITGYHLLPQWVVRPAAITVALAEAIIGIALVAPETLPLPLLAMSIPLISVLLLVSLAAIRSPGVTDCGCGGIVGSHRPSYWKTASNAVLLALALSSITVTSMRSSPPYTLPTLSLIVMTAGASLLVVIWCANLDVLIHPRPAIRRWLLDPSVALSGKKLELYGGQYK